MKMYEFWLQFRRSLFLGAQLTILWMSEAMVDSPLTHASLGLNEFICKYMNIRIICALLYFVVGHMVPTDFTYIQ